MGKLGPRQAAILPLRGERVVELLQVPAQPSVKPGRREDGFLRMLHRRGKNGPIAQLRKGAPQRATRLERIRCDLSHNAGKKVHGVVSETRLRVV